MSLVRCPCCGNEINIFGPGRTADAAAEMNVPLFDRLPIFSELAELGDQGRIEDAPADLLPNLVASVRALIERKPR